MECPLGGRQVRKGETVRVASLDEKPSYYCNRTHDLLVRCFIADWDPPPQTARPPNQFMLVSHITHEHNIPRAQAL